MKQKLWVLNSALLLILVIVLLISMLFQQPPPVFRIKKPVIPQPIPQQEVQLKNVDNIFKFDLFGSAIFPRDEEAKSKSLVTPIPEPKISTPPPPVEPAKPEFLPPLNVSLKGIAFAGSEDKSVVMIADETNKETVYHLGDMVKDAQLIKISKQKVILLRPNGQHETFFLRKDDNKLQEVSADKKWEEIVKRIENNKFEIDLLQFPKQVPSVGNLIEMLSCITAYTKGKPIGLRVGKFPIGSIGPSLGLQTNDIIISINNILMADKVNRVQAYEKISQLKAGDIITVALQRNSTNLTLTYHLTHIKRAVNRQFIPTSISDSKEKPQEAPFKMSELQEREQRLREFNERNQQPERQGNVIEEIRQRLLENMRAHIR